jgi:hypothetical protein
MNLYFNTNLVISFSHLLTHENICSQSFQILTQNNLEITSLRYVGKILSCFT